MNNVLARKLFKYLIAAPTGLLLGAVNTILLKNTLAIFVYHEVSDRPSEFCALYDLNVRPDVFKYQMDFIKRHFIVISPDDLLESRIPSNAAMVTFDDGFRGVFENAIPILESHKIPAIIFLNMEAVKGKSFWAGLITYLCEKDPKFGNYLKENVPFCHKGANKMPFYLWCTKELVETYLRGLEPTIAEEVTKFTGEIAKEIDLENASKKDLVFFGNHLYNHYVALHMSDNELLQEFFKNAEELKRYPNYRNMFSFPFGQPKLCFTGDQIDLLLKNGIKKVFSTYPIPNRNVASHYLHRIPLSIAQYSSSRIWFSVFQRSLRDWIF